MLHVGSRRFCTDCRWFNDSSNKLAWKLETKVVDPKGKPGVVNYPVIVGPFVPNPHTVYVKLQKIVAAPLLQKISIHILNCSPPFHSLFILIKQLLSLNAFISSFFLRFSVLRVLAMNAQNVVVLMWRDLRCLWTYYHNVFVSFE